MSYSHIRHLHPHLHVPCSYCHTRGHFSTLRTRLLRGPFSACLQDCGPWCWQVWQPGQGRHPRTSQVRAGGEGWRCKSSKCQWRRCHLPVAALTQLVQASPGSRRCCWLLLILQGPLDGHAEAIAAVQEGVLHKRLSSKKSFDPTRSGHLSDADIDGITAAAAGGASKDGANGRGAAAKAKDVEMGEWLGRHCRRDEAAFLLQASVARDART